jgi:hypothetical protein
MKMNNDLHSQRPHPAKHEREDWLLKKRGVAVNVENIKVSFRYLSLQYGVIRGLGTGAHPVPAAFHEWLIMSDDFAVIFRENRDNVR